VREESTPVRIRPETFEGEEYRDPTQTNRRQRVQFYIQ